MFQDYRGAGMVNIRRAVPSWNPRATHRLPPIKFIGLSFLARDCASDGTIMPREQRRWPRKPVHALGCLYACDGQRLGPCRIKDVSHGGAKIAHSVRDELPAEFLLLLSRDGRVRRRCQVAWRAKDQIGVRF